MQTPSLSSIGPASNFKRWVYFCFFLSGLSALVYEVVWLNRIQLIMGHSVYSLATTIAAYLSGIALGAWLAPRFLKQGINGVWLYFVAELAIGIYGLVFYPLLTLIEAPYHTLVHVMQPGLFVLSLMQFILFGLLIFIPTALMGMTLPFLAHELFKTDQSLPKNLPGLYATNTFGAFFGTMLTGFVLLPALGYTKTVFLAAGINLTLFAIALHLFPSQTLRGLSQKRPSLTQMLMAGPNPNRLQAGDWSLILILAVSGTAAMLVQVIWNRMAALAFGSSVYIFPMVTGAVLLGIVLGSFIFSRLNINREKASQALTAACGLASIFLLLGNSWFSQVPHWVYIWRQRWEPEFWAYSALCFGTIVLVTLPAAAAMGAIFPAAATLLSRDKESGTHALARGYAMNILGLVLGAVLGSFVLIPYVGVETTGTFVATLLAGSAALLALVQLKSGAHFFAFLGLFAVAYLIQPQYDWRAMTEGYFYDRKVHVNQSELLKKGYLSLKDQDRSNRTRLLDKADDVHATISIHESFPDGTRFFRINGKTDGNNRGDLQTTRLVALIPLLAKQEFSNVLTIGLGIGSTVAETLRFPGLQKTTVVELSTKMVDFARRYFSDVNDDIWVDDRVNIVRRDGRQFLRQSKETYDLIISEPSNPWVDGVASLFTKEYYQLVSDKLAPGGVASLWFHTYGLDCTAIYSVLKSAAEVFPSLMVFKISGDLYILGSNEDSPMQLRRFPMGLRTLENDLIDVADVYKSSGTRKPSSSDPYRTFMQKYFRMDETGVRIASRNFIGNSDDNQFLQYQSGKTYWQSMGCSEISSRVPKSMIPQLLNRYGLD